MQLDQPYLNLSVPALYLETLAISRGRQTASSQRFSYFGSLAEGDGGDCVCVEQMKQCNELPAVHPLHHRPCGPDDTCPQNPIMTTFTDLIYSDANSATSLQARLARVYRTSPLSAENKKTDWNQSNRMLKRFKYSRVDEKIGACDGHSHLNCQLQ